MCYDDDRNPDTFPMIERCQLGQIDCANDTYYDPRPEPGEWLATHWNIGAPHNRFVDVVCIPRPPRPDLCES
jgi:hypothetical protein